MKKKRPTKPEDAAVSFEDSLAELEAIVSELESGKLGLSEALARYEHGVKHLKSCQQLLQRAERRIELLSGVDANGNPVTRAFDDREWQTLEEKAAGRSQRRTGDPRGVRKAAATSDDVDDSPTLF